VNDSYICGFCHQLQEVNSLSMVKVVYNMQACHECAAIDGLSDTVKALTMLERNPVKYADFGKMYVTKAQFDCLTKQHWKTSQFEILA